MGFLKIFRAPKAKIELKLDKIVFEMRDGLTGRVVIEPQEDITVNELRLEFAGVRKIRWQSGSRGSLAIDELLSTNKISIGGSVFLHTGQDYEQGFHVDIPPYSKSNHFVTEMDVKVKCVAVFEGRPDLTCELKPAINFPYIIECLVDYGGCEFVTPPSPQPAETCPKCGKNLRQIWDAYFNTQAARTAKAMASWGGSRRGSRRPSPRPRFTSRPRRRFQGNLCQFKVAS